MKQTSRERPKSAPYPSLKNSKRTSKFPSIGELGLLLFLKKNLKKSLTTPKKTEREDPLGFFNVHSVAKLQKMKGAFRGEKSRTVPKKWTLSSRPVLYVTRETFLVQFLGPTGTFWRLLKIL